MSTAFALLPSSYFCRPGHSDGDGQYLHYLTKWAFALNQLAAATGDARYLTWAIELMHVAHKAFVYTVGVS